MRERPHRNSNLLTFSCLDVAHGRLNLTSNETQTHS